MVSNYTKSKKIRLHAKVLKKPTPKKKKDERPSMTPYEEALHEHLLQAKSYLDDVEGINESFEDNLEEI